MTTGARLMAALECANDAGGRCALWPSGDAHACCGVSHDTATSCAFAAGSVSAARAALTGTGATPQSEGLVRVRGRCVCAPAPALLGSLPSHRSFQEGCWTDEAGYARHHRHRSGSGRRPRFPGAVPRHGRQPGSGPHRLPRSGPSHRDPRLVLRGARPSPSSLPGACASRSGGCGFSREQGAAAGAGCHPGPPRPRTTHPRS